MFAAHKTYHLREGWIFKGLAAIIDGQARGETRNVFLDPEAPLRFGVGPSMVQAIRFWLRATGLTNESSLHGRETSIQLTAFGQRRLGCRSLP